MVPDVELEAPSSTTSTRSAAVQALVAVVVVLITLFGASSPTARRWSPTTRTSPPATPSATRSPVSARRSTPARPSPPTSRIGSEVDAQLAARRRSTRRACNAFGGDPDTDVHLAAGRAVRRRARGARRPHARRPGRPDTPPTPSPRGNQAPDAARLRQPIAGRPGQRPRRQGRQLRRRPHRAGRRALPPRPVPDRGGPQPVRARRPRRR